MEMHVQLPGPDRHSIRVQPHRPTHEDEADVAEAAVPHPGGGPRDCAGHAGPEPEAGAAAKVCAEACAISAHHKVLLGYGIEGDESVTRSAIVCFLCAFGRRQWVINGFNVGCQSVVSQLSVGCQNRVFYSTVIF